MENKPKICIYLENTSQIKVESETDFMGKPVNFSFGVEEFKNSASRAADMGELIVTILSTWHRQEFEDAGFPTKPASPIFGELQIVESLITRSVRQDTLVHSATIEELLLSHAASDKDDVWLALAEDWPKIRSQIGQSSKKS